MILQEQIRIEKALEKARDFLQNGDLNKALRTIAKVKNSFCVTESRRAIIFIEALVLATRRKTTQAKTLICNHNYAAWGCERLQQLLRELNSPCESQTKLFSIRIKTDNAATGIVASYAGDYYCDLYVLANEHEEALHYIKEFCGFAKIEDIGVLSSFEVRPADQGEYKGIVLTSPFTRFEDNSDLNKGEHGV